MPDFYYNPSEWNLDTRQLNVTSNCPVGFPREQICVCLTNNKIHIPGPPIEINHPPEYNPLKYYCNAGAGTLKYGIQDIYNVTDSAWLSDSVNEVTDVDSNGTTITITTTGSFLTKNETCIVYYYARVAHDGGRKVTPIQGDLWSPAVTDVLVRKANDSAPSRFGTLADDTSDHYTYSPDMMYNTAVNCSSAGWTTLLNYSGIGTFRIDDFPVYVTELIVKFTKPGTWPSQIFIRVTTDGEEIFREFGGSFGNYDDFLRYEDFDSTQYTEAAGPYTTGPPNIKCAADRQLFFDIYETADGKACFRLPIEIELLSDMEIEILPSDQNLSSVDCYVRGWYKPS
jgi:hypothetical protein